MLEIVNNLPSVRPRLQHGLADCYNRNRKNERIVCDMIGLVYVSCKLIDGSVQL